VSASVGAGIGSVGAGNGAAGAEFTVTIVFEMPRRRLRETLMSKLGQRTASRFRHSFRPLPGNQAIE
jgi:hypothetical protein